MEYWRRIFSPFGVANVVCVFFLLLSLWEVPAESIFVADNQVKIQQAQAFLDSGFLSQYSTCLELADFGGCAYTIGGEGRDVPILIGVFPVAFSLYAALVRLTGDYNHLIYISFLFFLAGTWFISFRVRKDFWIPVVLTFGPCFFHSFLFPDYAIVFFLIAVLVGFYYRPLFGKYSNFMIGLVSGSAVFFRPEVVFLPFFLGLFSVIETFRSGLPARNTEEERRFYLLIGFGSAVILFFGTNYALYENFLGTRIRANEEGIESFLNWGKFVSLLFYGNSRIGFFLFSSWVLFALIYLSLRFRILSSKEKHLLLSVLLSIFVIVLLSPNDSNIDWGTRYLSWLTIPVAVLFFTSDFRQSSQDRRWKKFVIFLFILSLIVVFAFFRLQIKVAEEFQKYNSLLKGLSGEVSILTEPSILGFYGKDVLKKKVLLLRPSESRKEFVRFLSGKASRLELVRYEPTTYFLLESIRPPHKKVENAYLLEKEFLDQGWKVSNKKISLKLEILSLQR
ncbi:LA_3751/LA_3752 family putative glycosyltransferase [Leptospira wolffii]|uniref:LA_3751/LA_3752 family putative glycosyltransferase n=1 Tax=Leptospira wolffii TaxID=409998 RepID=A0ABV5BLA9_9LEPT